MAQAGTGFIGGMADASAARSAGKVNSILMESQILLNTANTRAQQSQLMREFEMAARQNAVSIAVSGLSSQSFAAVAKGNRREMERGIEALEITGDTREIGMRAEQAIAMAEARANAAAARFSGIVGAAGTIWEAERNYQMNNTGQSRIDYFKGAL